MIDGGLTRRCLEQVLGQVPRKLINQEAQVQSYFPADAFHTQVKAWESPRKERDHHRSQEQGKAQQDYHDLNDVGKNIDLKKTQHYEKSKYVLPLDHNRKILFGQSHSLEKHTQMTEWIVLFVQLGEEEQNIHTQKYGDENKQDACEINENKVCHSRYEGMVVY